MSTTTATASISYPHHGYSSSIADVTPESLQLHHQSRTVLRSGNIAMATCYQPYELTATQRTQVPPQTPQKDYSRPLHVDCSVEYELPNTAKPPQGVRNEPLLMIHPCYFRKIESQRRSPFVNNLPAQVAATPAAPASAKRHRASSVRPSHHQQPQLGAQYPTQYQYHHQEMPYCKRDQFTAYAGWTDPERSPDRPDQDTMNSKHQHILSGKYRQYLRAHRLHPYGGGAIPLASTFPQVCYNV